MQEWWSLSNNHMLEAQKRFKHRRWRVPRSSCKESRAQRRPRSRGRCEWCCRPPRPRTQPTTTSRQRLRPSVTHTIGMTKEGRHKTRLSTSTHTHTHTYTHTPPPPPPKRTNLAPVVGQGGKHVASAADARVWSLGVETSVERVLAHGEASGSHESYPQGPKEKKEEKKNNTAGSQSADPELLSTRRGRLCGNGASDSSFWPHPTPTHQFQEKKNQNAKNLLLEKFPQGRHRVGEAVNG